MRDSDEHKPEISNIPLAYCSSDLLFFCLCSSTTPTAGGFALWVVLPETGAASSQMLRFLSSCSCSHTQAATGAYTCAWRHSLAALPDHLHCHLTCTERSMIRECIRKHAIMVTVSQEKATIYMLKKKSGLLCASVLGWRLETFSTFRLDAFCRRNAVVGGQIGTWLSW